MESAWGSMLSVRPTLDEEVRAPSRRDDFACCVQIMGEWQGAVTMRCSRSLATELTAIMFSLEVGEVDDELRRDALGELANMIAGNVKALAPGEEHHISMPAVAEGDRALLSLQGGDELGEVRFLCMGSPLSVASLEKAAS